MKVIMLGGILDIDEWNHSVVVRKKKKASTPVWGILLISKDSKKRERLSQHISASEHDQQIMFRDLKGYLLTIVIMISIKIILLVPGLCTGHLLLLLRTIYLFILPKNVGA